MAALHEARGELVLAPRRGGPDPGLMRDVARRIIQPALLEAAIQDAREEARQ